MFMSLFFNFFILQVWQGLLKFSENYLNLDLQITPFFKNKHFELCCFVMYRVHNIVNRRESDVICHSVRRSRVPTSIYIYRHKQKKHPLQRGKEHGEHWGKIQPQGKSKYHQNKLTSSRAHIWWPGSPLVIDFPLPGVSACHHFDYFYRLNFPCVLFVC